jgi:hypothetical protein
MGGYMKSLLNGCAAVALFAGVAGQACAQIEVRDTPVYAVPAEGEAPASAIAAAPQTDPSVAKIASSKSEAQVVKALVEQKAPPAPPTLTPDETAFFSVLGRRVTDAASAYETYVRRAGAIDGRFGDAAAVQRAVRTGAAYQPQQLQEGIVAYAALLALRNQDFVDGVRAMRDPSFADRLARSSQSVLNVRGADFTASDVAGVLRAQGASLLAAGKSITQAAYDVQAQSWSKTPVSDPKGVLADAKEAALLPRAASVPAKQRLLDSLVAPQVMPASNTSAVSEPPDVVRGLALAALAILGRTGDDKEATFETILHDSTSADCLKLAKMNLNQCLAVAGPQYEDVYCTGRHGVGETASCISAAANGAGSSLPAPTLAPVRRADGYGPEEARAYGRPGLQPQDRDDDDTLPSAPQRYASIQPSEPAPRLYARPATEQTYAEDDGGYAPAPYQEPQRYAQAQPAPQYSPYPEPGYQPSARPYSVQPQYPAPQAYQGEPYAPSPYGYANRGGYGQ